MSFHEERLQGIGGSDVGAVFNLDWGCRRALWYEKRSVPQDFPPEQKPELLRRGKLLEDDAIQEYEAVTDRNVTIDDRLMTSGYDTFAIVHIDGWVYRGGNSGVRAQEGILEIKVLGRESFRRMTKGGLRESYILQLQHAMYVTGAPWGSFGVLCLDPWKLAFWDVERDEDMIKSMIAEEEIFWTSVQNGPMPDALADTKDRRCYACPWRRTCRGEQFIEQPPDEDDEIARDDSLAILATMYEEAQDLLAEAKEWRDELHDRVIDAMAGRKVLDTGSVRLYYRASNVTRWDAKALSQTAEADKEFAEAMKKFRVTTAQTSLRTFQR